ncbi:TlyA family RNA methyltransferase [Candidatus Mycoplasma mahonii]|uniref:TlyA family RNA methyltransferase n=1 Tax=Candidatus Mycoplasma mahonii TaxID=3004105 RepID=UPI0026ED3B19|nr:TlyA family RNA methyltransferase [Candidatus Mycoplasma mahonii]WKX02207.1 TlyA family RNA methyltransferase [Candidatus Mycoplasma mahonii]
MTILEKLVKLGYEKEKAKRIIMSGQVKINENIIFIPSEKILEEDQVSIKESKQWVSRGAYKLLAAIDEFNINFKDLIVLDIGSSTGGFSHVALAYGAKHVYALDVGTNQLSYKIRSDKRVTTIEKTNLKTITKDMFQDKIDFVVTDVSFISLKYMFQVAKDIGDESLQIMALIKPQFEANSNQVEPGGFVPEEIHSNIIDKVKKYAVDNNFKMSAMSKSPIKGKKIKNIEYITLFERN